MITILDTFTEYESQNSRAVHTQEAYKGGLRIFKQYLVEKNVKPDDPLYKLQAELFVTYPSWLGTRNYSKKTLGVYLSAVKSFMNFLTIKGYLDLTYSQSVRWAMATKEIQRKRESKLRKFTKHEDVEKLIETVKTMKAWPEIKERNIALILLLASTGCRNEEIAKLKVRNISYSDTSLVVVGKGSKERRVYFSSEAGLALKDYLSLREVSEDQFVFLRHDKAISNKISGITTQAIRGVVKKVCSTAGIEFRPHDFRRSFATHMLDVTHDLSLVQDLLGHSNPLTTRVYANISQENMRKGYQQVYG